MILAAGLGTRLRPLTDDRPKALVTVAGRTLLEIALLRLRAFGVRDVVVNVHHHAVMIVEYLKANSNFGMNIEISREEELLDTGGGLKNAASFFLDSAASAQEPFLLHNVDVLSNLDLARLAAFHTEHAALATLAVQDRATSRYLLFDESGRLCGRRAGLSGEPELVRPARQAQALAFSGIHVLSPLLEDQEARGRQCRKRPAPAPAAQAAPILVRRQARASAAEAAALIEQQIARSCAVLHSQRGEGGVFGVECGQAREIEVAEDIDVVQEERLLRACGGIEKERRGVLQATAGVQQLLFARDFDVHAEVAVGFEVLDDHNRVVMDVDDDIAHAESAQAEEGDLQQGAAGDGDQRLGAVIGEGPQARAQAGGKNHRLHWPSFSVTAFSGSVFSSAIFSSSMCRTATSTPLKPRRCFASCSARYTERCWPPVQPNETIRLLKPRLR